MGTRCGAIDAGALLYLLRRKLYDDKALQHLLYEESGLKGLSGISNDVRTLLDSDAPEAKQAIDYFVYQIVYFAGATRRCSAASTPSCSPRASARSRADPRGVCAKLAWLGLELDEAANRRRPADLDQGQQGPRLGDPDQRRDHDRPAYADAGGQTLSRAGPAESRGAPELGRKSHPDGPRADPQLRVAQRVRGASGGTHPLPNASPAFPQASRFPPRGSCERRRQR